MTVFFGYQNTFSDRKDTTDGSGTVTGRVVTTQTYRMPDKILLHEQKGTYALQPTRSGFSGSSLQLVTSDIKDLTWEESVYGPNGALNQPHELNEVTKSYGYKNTTDDPNATPTFQQVAETQTAFAYDSFTKKLLLQVTTRLTLQQDQAGLDAKGKTIPVGTWRLLPETTHTTTLADHADSGGGLVGYSGYNVVWNLATAGGAATPTPVVGVGDVALVQTTYNLAAGRRPGGVTSGGQ